VASITLRDLSKRFDSLIAVNRLSLEIQEGELITLLGPSGCGKTTTLRMIGGFETPNDGEIYFGERPVTWLQPELRNIGIVFQNYALFPHMTVYENIAFGLEMRKEPPAKEPPRRDPPVKEPERRTLADLPWVSIAAGLVVFTAGLIWLLTR